MFFLLLEGFRVINILKRYKLVYIYINWTPSQVVMYGRDRSKKRNTICFYFEIIKRFRCGNTPRASILLTGGTKGFLLVLGRSMGARRPWGGEEGDAREMKPSCTSLPNLPGRNYRAKCRHHAGRRGVATSGSSLFFGNGPTGEVEREEVSGCS